MLSEFRPSFEAVKEGQIFLPKDELDLFLPQARVSIDKHSCGNNS